LESIIRSPLFLLTVSGFVALEALWRVLRARRGYDFNGAAGSFGVAAGNFLLKPLNAGVIGAALLALYQVTPLRLPSDDWRTWVAGFFAVEFVYYWFHRWSHTVRWLWASHAVHHSANEMTFPAAIRLGWTGALSGGWVLFAPLILLGFHPVMVATLLSANLAYQFFLHTEAVGKLGLLEWVLNTPSHHRVHHASNKRYIDKNFGGVLIVFDRWFGSFAAESHEEPIRYGLVRSLTSNNPFVIALHEWWRMGRDLLTARSLQTAWRALFGRPGAGGFEQAP